MINHLLERLRNFRGEFHRLTDGRSLGRTKIRRLHPRFGALRFRPAVGTALAVAIKFPGRRTGARRLRWRRGRSDGSFNHRFFGGRQRGFLGRRGEFRRLFGVRFAKITGRIGLRISGLVLLDRFLGGHGSRSVFRRRYRIFFTGTRGAGTAPATTTAATAAVAGTAGGGGQV